MLNVSPLNCCGCTACKQICHHGAISLKADALGFTYPLVSEELCVRCGRCEDVCPFHNAKFLLNAKKTVGYAAQHKEIKEVGGSRSGAVFVALTDIILKTGGVVYGARLDDKFNVIHGRAETREERNSFRGSKYAQSCIDGVYRLVLADLKNGRRVLFSGTPCQVAALSRMAPEACRTHLVLVDIICHGVASPAVWRDWLRYVSRHELRKLIGVNFRDKKIFGWDGLHRESFTYDDGKVRTFPATYYQPFLIRESCSACPFASIHRASDLTLGDFWGYEKVVPEFPNADKGISLVLVNSSIGRELFKASQSLLVWKQVPLSACLQPNLMAPTSSDRRRNFFVKDYSSKEFKYVRKRYWPISLNDWLKYYVKRVISR